MASDTPSFLEQVRDLFRLAGETLNHLPYQVTAWLRSRHYPYDLLGDGSVATCRICHDEWPCAEFVRLDALLTEQQNGSREAHDG